jgi:UDP-glucose 4-epimerase
VHALITGAGGFIGAVVSRAFAAEGWKVSAVYRKRAPAGAKGIDLLQADLASGDALPRAYDVLVHCASEVPAFCPDPERLYRSNVEGTRKVLEHSAKAGARSVVYLSSMAVYGATETALIDERTPIAPTDAYGKSKADCEAAVAEWAETRGAGAVSIRLPGIVGRDGRNNFLCDALRQIIAGQGVVARNPDALFNNLVHVADLARFIVSLGMQMPNTHSVLTVAADQPLTVREVLVRLFRRAGAPERISWQAGGRAPFLIGFERSRALGYRPATVADSVERFVADSVAAA